MAATTTEELDIKQRFEELCLGLNLDDSSGREAWDTFERISVNYTLEGDDLHWLVCALYVACRRSTIPTVGNGTVEGNCVSLTRLLRSARLSVIQFFSKMKKWEDMANLPQQFRDKVERLERNFNVSTVIFKKYQPIYLDIFKSVTNEQPRVPRGRKQRRQPCSNSELFSFCWTLFTLIKGNFPAISDDLVNSYHLLLCCLDLVFANIVLANRRDLLNPDFSGLPENYLSRTYAVPQDCPCIIEKLCELHDGLVLEAKGIKEHWWKPHIRKLIEEKVLKGNLEKLSGLVDTSSFEPNSKSINKQYEEYVLTKGDFDERIFLSDDANEEIGTPAKSPAMKEATSLRERMQAKRNLPQYIEKVKTLCPSTPLTNRRYLKDKDPTVTPVSTATQTVSRLQALLAGRKVGPSDELQAMLTECCSQDISESIVNRVKEMGELFCQRYTQDDGNGPPIDFAKRRLTLAKSLYYKALESILASEKRRVEHKGKTDLSTLLDHDIFHRSLLACCLEVIIFAYNSQKSFPWILEIFELPAFHFYKVIELLLRAEEGLSRDIVKHLNHVEEEILQDRAWRGDSPVWGALRESRDGAPSCEDVSITTHQDNGTKANGSGPQPYRSPVVHQRVRMLMESDPAKKDALLQSPTSARDRFSSPSPGSAKRRLFVVTSPVDESSKSTNGTSDESSLGETTLESGVTVSVKPKAITLTQPKTRTVTQPQTVTVTIQGSIKDKDGNIKFVSSPLKVTTSPRVMTRGQTQQLSNATTSKSPLKDEMEISVTGTGQGEVDQAAVALSKPRRTGSVGLFFRKVFHLVNVRLLDLAHKLNLSEDLRRKTWTCIEYSLTKHVDLMKDRHLDQLIMSAIYLMCKVTKQDQKFQDIMRAYRRQPQAQSHVYRSVLLQDRRQHSANGTNGANGNGSRQSSPDADKQKVDSSPNPHGLRVRSASTLPIHSGSAPPTPTRMAGTSSSFEDEDRGDLITFYNSIFVKRIQHFALRFSPPSEGSQENLEAPSLSPMPVIRPHPASPRKVSSRHEVYVTPHANSIPVPTSPNQGMLYFINKSPAKNLRDINNMIKLNGERQTPKRVLPLGDANDSSPKRICMEPNRLAQRIISLKSDR
ncbi:retinoblastoma-like protein 1 isoform X1 [Asterias rubens]|uniref:retinoblastoma-like protein 1 isoform X1 n=1 Tax=Asterias rubens TaxID=7604 RepID=UPI0014550804|nr:retinoblastoma-like protein 1 isoform X1 [Asterias rubens]